MSAHVCRIFQSLYNELPDDGDEPKRENGAVVLYETYCPINDSGNQQCNSNLDKIIAGFGYLLPQLFGNVDNEEDHEDQEDNYVYYALLWVSYKLQQLNKNNDKPIGLNEFFNKHIAKGDWYEEFKEQIESKIHLVDKEIDIDLMSDVYYIFKQMCGGLSNQEDDFNYLEDFSTYYYSVKICAEKLKKSSNNGNADISDDQYLAIYDMLHHVYADFRKDYLKNNPECDKIPDLPNFKEIEVTPEPDLDEPDLDELDPQENTNEDPETQDGDVDNIPICPDSEFEDPEIEETVVELENFDIEEEVCIENWAPESPNFETELPIFEAQIFDFHIELPKFETELPIIEDEIPKLEPEHLNFEIGLPKPEPKLPDFIGGLEVSDMEVGYPIAPENLFFIDTGFSKLEDDLSIYEVKYSDLESNPPNIVDELYVPENELSYPMVKPEIIDFELPDLNIEQNDSDNQSQPHQINILTFDDPFKNPENFSDNIMCKLYGPKSVYCNRIVCNRIKIGVIALSIPIILVFIYKYFPWKRTKKPKKTKKMKKVVNLLDRKKTKTIGINSIDDKKTMQITINSDDKKKTTKKIIDSNDKEKTPKRIINSNDKEKTAKRIISSNNGKTTLLFNIYKQMQLSPMPFIHLFMLLIFFIFKRKKDSIE
ncbi:CIR protein [Plasmodium chabaudi chabaudi]|uniref:CIR protein n=1 Tax=Plasmodium chabaudi chabaudi TaxID=31271 RepID=A0A077TME1_PLACU|nr:CIR protein [Plasmodium chabaudi chabaudi]SCL88569.1 CIR protein [Plasmodium chabaudi chabaudi]VTZ67323.1 CIR protein [Plasmodium chabaudi chabaudi]|eukprot:XP_016653349.1 CIR protein [Plasmodium chabaudi chabaudi]